MPPKVRPGHPHMRSDVLARLMEERNLSRMELARKAGVVRWVITRAMRGEAISVTSFRKIAEALAKAPVVSELEASLLEEAG